MGALKERNSHYKSERDKVTAELTALLTSGRAATETSAMPSGLLPPPVEYAEIDEDCIMVVSPSGDSYAAATAATSKSKARPKMKREEFPELKTPNTPIPTRSAASVKSRLGSKKNKSAKDVKQKAAAAKSMNKARSAKVGPRFEVTVGFEGWTEVRKFVEQKLSNPKFRSVKTKNGGLVLFPEDDTAAALRRTTNLVERAPRLPRVIIKHAD